MSCCSLQFFLCIFVLWTIPVFSLDVSFIPNDENAPLPLSANYREALRKLCKIIASNGERLPPELKSKKAVLNKMCAKLKKDDDNIGWAFRAGEGGTKLRNLGITCIAIGGGYMMWQHKEMVAMFFRSVLRAARDLLQRTNSAAAIPVLGGGGGGRGDGDGVGQEHASSSSSSSVGHKLGSGAAISSTGTSISRSSLIPGSVSVTSNILSSGGGSEADIAARRLAEARLARLRRFAQMDSVSKSVASGTEERSESDDEEEDEAEENEEEEE